MTSDGNDKFTLFVDKQIGKFVNRLSPKQGKIFLAGVMASAIVTAMTFLFIYPFAMGFQEHDYGAFESWALATLVVIGLTTFSIAFAQRKEIVKWVDQQIFSDIDEGRLFGIELKALSSAYSVAPETLVEVRQKSNTDTA